MRTVAGQIAASLSALSRTAENLDTMAKRETSQAKQEKGQLRVNKFRADYLDLKNQFDALKAELANQVRRKFPLRLLLISDLLKKSQEQRNALFQSSSGGPMTVQDARRRVAAQIDRTENSESPFQRAPLPDTSLRESHALREHSFIHSTGAQLDDFISQGREVLDNLVDQRQILQGTQRRLAGAAETIGLSRDVIGWIETRSKQDMYIFIGGAIFTFFCFYLILKYIA
jgi:Golgi SNAP receptor complex protein 2